MSDNKLKVDGPYSVPVEFKAKPSHPIKPSPSAEGTVGKDILPPIYADEQHSTWTMLYKRHEALIEGRLCNEYIEGRKLMQFPKGRVPHLAEISEHMCKYSGWQLARVDGYVPESTFFQILAQKRFPCTDFLRHPTELEYTPAPDMFHDLMGHIPLFTNPKFASFFHLYGVAGTHARSETEIKMLGRIYWFTVEFGLINPTAHTSADPAQSRIYGSGIASSVGEIAHSLSPKVKKYPFNIDKIALKEFDLHHMQEELFEISSFEELEKEFKRWATDKNLLP